MQIKCRGMEKAEVAKSESYLDVDVINIID